LFALQARGEYQDVAEPPFVPGNEAAGQVTEVGAAAASAFAVGDRVICVSRGGAFASELVADARQCRKLPAAAAAADLAEAAALLCNYGTAHLALSKRANLAAGETVLVTAGAGGVGLATVELARLMGARVIAACGSDDKLAIASGKGAQPDGVNYTGLDSRAFRARLKEVAGLAGIDVIVDMVGRDPLEAAIRSLNWNGRAVTIGYAGGAIPKIPANVLLVKNVSVAGLFWGAHLLHDPATLMASADQLISWWLAGDISPHVGERVPPARAHEAFGLIQGRQSPGQVGLVPLSP